MTTYFRKMPFTCSHREMPFGDFERKIFLKSSHYTAATLKTKKPTPF
jgi:hypothetical protein